MSNTNEYEAGYNAGFKDGQDIAHALRDLSEQVQALHEYTADLSERLRKMELRLRQVESPKMSASEALKLYDMLRLEDPTLNLATFAAQRNLSYDTLRQARSRQRRKKP